MLLFPCDNRRQYVALAINLLVLLIFYSVFMYERRSFSSLTLATSYTVYSRQKLPLRYSKRSLLAAGADNCQFPVTGNVPDVNPPTAIVNGNHSRKRPHLTRRIASKKQHVTKISHIQSSTRTGRAKKMAQFLYT